MTNSFNILDFAGISKERPWELQQPHPTDLRAVVATEHVPTADEIGTLLATFVGEAIEAEEIDSPATEIPWTMRVRIVGLPTDFVLWVEPLNEAARKEAKIESGWVLALQTVLHPGGPLTHFSNVMRLLAGVDLDIHSICDISTGRWFPRAILESVFIQSETEPPEEVLWITRLVEAPENGDPEDRWAWITTHGLTRCGRVELEMLGVPAVLSSEAVHIVDGLAALTLESPLPPEGEVISLGSQLLISLMPCDQAIKRLSDPMPGRENRDVPSVVIAASDGTMVYPHDVLDTLRGEDTAVAKTLRSTKRKAVMARDQWGVLLRAAQHIGESEHAACMIQIPWSNVEDEEAPREYLWFRVVETNQDSVVGELAHVPQYATSLPEGHREEVNSEDVTDWVLLTPIGPMGPDDAEAIDEFLSQFTN